MKHIKLFEEYKPHNFEWLSDGIRLDMINDTIKEWESDEEYKEECREEPEFDLLLDPYDGYESQSYIQYINDNELCFWEGWSDLCWNGAYSKDMYKSMTKEEILEHIKNVRFPFIARELNMDIISFQYWMEESWTEGVDSGYIMKICLKRK